MSHLKQHSFTGTSDHDFTGLNNNYLPKLNSVGTGITNSVISDVASAVTINGSVKIYGTGSTTGPSLSVYNSAGTNTFEIRGDGFATILDMTVGRGNSLIATNTALGYQALNSITTGSDSVGLGYQALRNVNSGSYNVAVGYAGIALTTSNQNTAVGYAALLSETTGSNNTAFGSGALQGQNGGQTDNAAFGLNALSAAGLGSSNAAFGRSAGQTSTGNNNVFLGNYAGYYETGNNKLFIDNAQRSNEADARAKALVYGVFAGVPSSQSLTFNANVGISNGNPAEKLHVSGGTIRINTANGTEGAGKIAVSDANGSISFSSTTSLGLGSGSVGGTGTAGTITKWLNSTALTDSIITEVASGVTVNGSVNILGDVYVLGTATTLNTQTVQALDNNILLNYSGSYVSAIYGGITVLSGTPNGTSSTWTIDSNGAWSANTGIFTTAVTINGGRLWSDGATGLNNMFWAASSSYPTINSGTRNTFIGDNDTGTFTVTGNYNNLFGSFQSIGLSSGQQNTIIGSYNSLAGLTTGSYNIGIQSNFTSNVSGSLAIGSTPDASNSVYIGSSSFYYPNWYLGLGKSTSYLFGQTNMNWYASSVSEGDADKTATIPIWRFNGSRATGSGSSGDIRFAISLSAGTGITWTTPTDIITVQGNSGFVGIGTTTPSKKLHLSGEFRLENSSYGSGKLAVSDASGNVSFSSTTDLGISTTASTVTKYTATTTLASSGTTITHNLNTNYIICAFWDSNGNPIIPQYQRTSANAISVTAATTATYDVVIHG